MTARRYSQANMERVLGLPQKYFSDPKNLKLPETRALLQMIQTFPWLLDVAENNFDPTDAQRSLIKAAVDIGAFDKKESGGIA